MSYFLFIAFLLISVFNLETSRGKEHLICKWSVLIFLAVCFFSYKIGRKYHPTLGVLLAYLGGSAIFTYLWPMNNYVGLDHVSRIIIALSSAKAFIGLIAVIFIVSLLTLHELKFLKSFFILITLLNSVIVIYQWLSGNTWLYRGGLFDNVSINGCIIGACYPLLIANCFNVKHWGAYIYDVVVLSLPIIAIMCSMSSVAVGVIAVGIAVYVFAKFTNIWVRGVLPLVLFASVLSVGYLSNPKDMFDDSLRFDLYKIQYKSWDKLGQHLFGYGMGAYRYFGVKTQIETKFMLSKEEGDYKGSYNLWLHNDWLQLLLENGIIGMILIAISAMFLLFYAWGMPSIFACLVAFMSGMLFHYPIHYPIHALFGIWLIAYVYLKRRYENATID